MEYKTEVQRAGRITLPAGVRKDFGITIGDVLTLIVENGRINLMTQQQTLDEARRLLRQHSPQGIGSVNEFLEERRKEAIAEEKAYSPLKGNTE